MESPIELDVRSNDSAILNQIKGHHKEGNAPNTRVIHFQKYGSFIRIKLLSTLLPPKYEDGKCWILRKI